MEEKTAILNAQYNEFCRLKNERDCINRERDELVKKFDALMLNRRQIEQTFALVSKRCEEITIIFNNEGGIIRNIGMSIEQDYRNTMVEVDANMSQIVAWLIISFINFLLTTLVVCELLRG